MGRSGSKLIYKAISHALAKENFPYLPKIIGVKLSTGGMWSPNKKLFKGMVHKTHLQAEELPDNSAAKVIFLFSAPSQSVLSVISNKSRKGDKWIKKHFMHLKAKGSFSEICSKDVLRIEEQIDGWINKTGTERLILRYERIWEFQPEIEKFLNLRIHLPAKKKRRYLNEDSIKVKNACEKFYLYLDSKVARLNDFEIFS